MRDGVHVYLREECVMCGRCAENCYAEALVLTGRVMNAEDVVREVLRDRIFYEISGGGVTLSGGEPIMQRDFSQAILEQCKSEGLHTAVETAANYQWSDLEMLLPMIDLVMMDIKHMDPNKHRMVTSVSNKRILDNAQRLAQTGKPLIIRVPVVPTVNDTPEEIEAIAKFVRDFPNLRYLELLPFHRLGESKYRSLGLIYPAGNLKTPTREKMTELAMKASEIGVKVKIAH